MRFTPRRRAAIAILVTWPFAYVWWDWCTYTGRALIRNYRNGYAFCGTWQGRFNSCDHYSRSLAWAELVAAAVLAVAIATLLALWVLQPIRDMAGVVDGFGPNSLAVRMRAGGPQDETRTLSDGIDAMLDRLVESYQAQRRFAANASHELRTPLATQRALIEVSLAQALTADQQSLLSRQLLATNERNEQLVDGLLTLAETDRGVVTRSALRLDRIVAAVAAEHLPTAEADGLTLRAEVSPVTVSGEQPLLERLVANLLSNAIKYNEPGGRVTVTLDGRGLLTVTNTGPPIPAQDVSGLFEPFRRRSGERLEHGNGVGLGLTIVRSIAAAHTAAIQARPEPDGGLHIEVAFRPQPTGTSTGGSATWR